MTTQPIGLVKAIPGSAVKSVYSQHDEYYVRRFLFHHNKVHITDKLFTSFVTKNDR